MKAPPTPESLVGRDSEIQSIENTLETLDSGHGGVVLCSGEPGIGKSTLAKYTAAKAISRGLSVYWGFCWEAGGAPAYWPWTQLLRSLTGDWDLTDQEQNTLSLLLPEIQRGGDSEAELQPDQARFMLLDAMRMMLARISAESALVLIFEDLHASDQDSLQLLHYLARHVSAMPILIIGTFREIEARSKEVSGPLSAIERDAQCLRLSRLSREDVARYLESRTGTRPRDYKLKEWFEVTAGNPLFLHELVGLLDKPARSGDPARSLPATVEQLIRQQVGYLTAEEAQLLSFASVLGKAFNTHELAHLGDKDPDSVTRMLDAATGAGILVASDQDDYEFSHGLYREVLYRDLSRERRTALHLKHSGWLKEQIASGAADSWSVLASHLSAAGSDYRAEAIGAWRQAAERATARLAFNDSSAMLNQAVRAFGDGPKYQPADRCDLLLECARAMLLAGDIDGGHKRCEEAFGIACQMEDPSLMAAAALTYGSAIVVASVDSTLINMLRECLEMLPESDVAVRACVLARLAGALQPAPNPEEPMEMARKALTQARQCGDQAVLYDALRFAIAALMDFAHPAERLELNREFLDLARTRGDIPAQFRCNLRLIIDASELADRHSFDEALDACERIAGRIGLPHYSWRVASVRAMQATIEGRFSDASRFLDRAEELADSIDDLEARVTIPIQRFAILQSWDSDQVTPMAKIQSRLSEAYRNGMAEAEFFIQPLIDASTVNEAGEARRLLDNPTLVTRTFAGTDRYSLVAVSDLALIAGDSQIAERAHEALRVYENECATLGLLGSLWCGPVAFQLGRISMAQDRDEEARQYLEKAIEISAQMRSRPYVARVHHELSLLARKLGDQKGEAVHTRSASQLFTALEMKFVPAAPVDSKPQSVVTRGPQEPEFAIRENGEFFEVRCRGETALIKPSKGLFMLHVLVGRPETDIHVLELVGHGTGRCVPDSDAGPALDQSARNAYRKRLQALKDELEDARELGDAAGADQIQGEMEFIARELSRAFGIGGRERPQAKASERARVNVRRRIMDAIRRIDQQLPGAGRYLENTIKTGSYCRYSPM